MDPEALNSRLFLWVALATRICSMISAVRSSNVWPGVFKCISTGLSEVFDSNLSSDHSALNGTFFYKGAGSIQKIEADQKYVNIGNCLTNNKNFKLKV